ncbi:hypothetical protein [Oligoflexus tunisiensis]|uniref:hypothetical protein n=1 Tax=Oligoflexus tunisiensis TaxID=708132 RepID=UPI00114D3448|nr:hypothetical protein [Oligoflexus tunisiensis]
MSGRSYFKSLFLFYVSALFGLFLFSGCQKSESAPTVGSTPKGNTQETTDNKDKVADDDDKDSSSDDKTGDDDKNPDDTTKPDPEPTPTPQVGPLPEAKQAELKTLFTGEWTSSCIKIENPDVAGQFFSATESWKLLADGNIEVTYHDFDDDACKTPSQGFESYVFGISKPVAVKELGSQHFYVEMNILKELDENGTLADATGKFLIMVKFETGGMSVDYADDLTATALSADAMKFTKK